MPGPPPSTAPRRRNPRIEAVTLPAVCRRPAPRWPLIDDVALTVARRQCAAAVADLELLLDAEDLKPTERARLDRRLAATRSTLHLADQQLGQRRRLERDMWRKLWRSPQAEAWHASGWTRDVATYVRLSVLAELGDLEALKEARMWSDRLGLSPKAMRAMLWSVADTPAPVPSPPADFSGRRLAAVDPNHQEMP